MCGLFGMFNVTLPDRDQQEELLRQLARKAQIRGVDSWGAAFIEREKVKTIRGLGPVSKWLAKRHAQVRRVARTGTVIGHTRAASRGDVSLVNAHPFRAADWTGAHNGCFQNSSELQLSARYVARGETDSEEALAWLVSEGLTLDAFRTLRGWFALTILKRDGSELVLAVDERTPFAVARIGDGLIWHSLSIALESSLQAVGINTEIEEIKNQIIRLPSGRVEPLSAAPITASTTSPHARRDATEIDWENDEGHLPFGGRHEQ